MCFGEDMNISSAFFFLLSSFFVQPPNIQLTNDSFSNPTTFLCILNSCSRSPVSRNATCLLARLAFPLGLSLGLQGPSFDLRGHEGLEYPQRNNQAYQHGIDVFVVTVSRCCGGTELTPTTKLTKLNQITQVSAGRKVCANAIERGEVIHIDYERFYEGR